jgi:hypothetical protein
MKYFIDTEFLEGPQKKLFGYTKPTIELISIGIVSEDGREFYAISKDFNLKEAWNRYDIKKEWYSIDESTQSTRDIKVYWIRENVLLPIYNEYICGDMRNKFPFTCNTMKWILKNYGKTNKQIAQEIIMFIDERKVGNTIIYPAEQETETNRVFTKDVNFYAYYADYDWVGFCWLFGKMIDLPTGFPNYCIDLKQILDEQEDIRVNTPGRVCGLKGHPNYPKQTNEHNALSDARWNYELYKFLKTL